MHGLLRLAVSLLFSLEVLCGTKSQAQPGEAARPIAGRLTIGVRCNQRARIEMRQASAIVYAVRGDTVQAVTANHAVRLDEPDCGVAAIYLGLRSSDDIYSTEATLSHAFDPKLDLALISAVFPDSVIRRLKIARKVGIRGYPENLYLLGCPVGGTCDDDALEVRVRRQRTLDSTFISVQSPLLEEGYSGGPAVDKAGQLVGMTLDFGGGNARLLSWEVIDLWLLGSGIPVTLQTRAIDALAPSVVGVDFALEDSPTDFDGASLGRSVRLRYSGWDQFTTAYAFSLERIATKFTRVCSSCGDRRTILGTVGYLASAGLEFSERNGARTVFGHPLALSVSASLFEGGMQVLGSRSLIDSLDYSNGLSPTSTFRTGWHFLVGGRIAVRAHLLLARNVAATFDLTGEVFEVEAPPFSRTRMLVRRTFVGVSYQRGKQ